MSARAALALAVLIVAALPAVASQDIYPDILNGPATQAEVNEANRTYGGCGTEACAAIRDIARAFMVILRRDVPSTMSHVRQPADPAEAANEAIERGLLSKTSRFADYCAILTKLAQHYSEYFVGHASIELANRLDGAGGACTADLLAAFPRTADVRAMIQDARETCQSDRRKGCGRDMR